MYGCVFLIKRSNIDGGGLFPFTHSKQFDAVDLCKKTPSGKPTLRACVRRISVTRRRAETLLSGVVVVLACSSGDTRLQHKWQLHNTLGVGLHASALYNVGFSNWFSCGGFNAASVSVCFVVHEVVHALI